MDTTDPVVPVTRDPALPRTLGDTETTTLRTGTGRWRHTYHRPREYYPYGMVLPGEIVTGPRPPEPAFFEAADDSTPGPAPAQRPQNPPAAAVQLGNTTRLAQALVPGIRQELARQELARNTSRDEDRGHSGHDSAGIRHTPVPGTPPDVPGARNRPGDVAATIPDVPVRPRRGRPRKNPTPQEN